MRTRIVAGSLALLGGLVTTTTAPPEAARAAEAKRSPLVGSWLLGGGGGDGAGDIAVDEQGNVYITGITQSPDFPTKQAAQGESGGSCDSPPCGDAFVAKFTPRGRLVYSTYLGGGEGPNSSGFDRGFGIWADDSGNAYVTGTTHSPDFPTTPTGFKPQLAPNEGGDAFVAKLDPQGAIVYSTFLGGTMSASGAEGADEGQDIVADAEGNAYVVGYTSNLDFPIRGGVQMTHAGAEDVFVAKLDSSGSQLVYSTYLGGQGHDFAGGIALAGGSIFVGGYTSSTDFPTTDGVYQESFGGGVFDAFVTRLDPLALAPTYSTFVGGSKTDVGVRIQAATDETIYVAGTTASADFPTRNALMGFSGGPSDGFIASLSSDGADLTFATYFGGPRKDEIRDVALSDEGGAFITGITNSARFPTKTGFQSVKAGGLDAFVAAIGPQRSLRMSTLLGGEDVDTGWGVAHRDGKTYVSGSTSSRGFPRINSRRRRGSSDSFIAIIRRRRSRCSMLGSVKEDRVFGTPVDDILCGLGADDSLFGRAGNDVLKGGRGYDSCRGGRGKDSLSCERRL